MDETDSQHGELLARYKNPPLEMRWLGTISYADGLHLQNDLVDLRRKGEIGDTVLLLEHEPVYTIGRTRDRSSLVDENALPHPVHEINRGGQATFHGPGQLVGYPILDLQQFGRDLHLYLRVLEDALIEACRDCGVAEATRREGLTGVWAGDRKLASIGVGVRHWISMHGFALNVSGSLEAFDSIIPCGISQVSMGSIETETGTTHTPREFSSILMPFLASALESIWEK